MDEENKTNGEVEPIVDPVAELSQQHEETDPLASFDSTNASDHDEEPKIDYSSEVSEPIVSIPIQSAPQSFDMVQSTPVSAAVEIPATVEPVMSIKDQKPYKKTVVPSDSKPKKHILRTIILIVVFLVLAGAAASAAYIYRDGAAVNAEKQKSDEISALNTKVIALQIRLDAEIAKKTPVVDQTPTSVKPGVVAIANIKESITSGNTAALEGYMATSVNVIIAASEGVGVSTPAVAVSNITTFIADATAPWNFELAASVLSSYGQGSYKQYFPSTALVGKSANNKVISFGFDASTKINTVFLSASDSLLK